jgi:hypothetical protein
MLETLMEGIVKGCCYLFGCDISSKTWSYCSRCDSHFATKEYVSEGFLNKVKVWLLQ